MNKKAIKKTAVLYWSEKYRQFMVRSPLLDGVLGVGDSEDEAWATFDDILEDAYGAYLEGRMKHVYDKPGRPVKDTVALNSDVKPTTKNEIKRLADSFGCSLGEAIDFLLFYHQAKEGNVVSKAGKPKIKPATINYESIIPTLEEIKNRMSVCESAIESFTASKKINKRKSSTN
jgi:predicted RNase H-like HicB family nuclease